MVVQILIQHIMNFRFQIKNTNLWIVVLVCLLLTGCQTEIEVELPEYSPKLVIEGSIENGAPAMVVITRSIPYFSEMDLQYLKDSVLVMDAEVSIATSDGESERLSFQYCNDSPLYFAYKGSHILGKENTAYTLTVKWGGKTYTAKTSIPQSFDIDSLWFDCPSDLVNADTMRTLRVLLTDDAATADYYRFQVKVNCARFSDRLWVSTLPPAFDDRTFNGLTFNYELERYGVSSILSANMSEDEARYYRRLSFRPGDTVFVKHSRMDYATYRFLATGGYEAVMGSNPFMNPAPVVSNIDGVGVLGAWCGYASKTDTIIWKE